MAYTTTNDMTRFNLFERPEVYAGYRMLNPEGRRVGKAKVPYANGEPEHVRVKIGYLRLRSNLLPVEAPPVAGKRRALVLEQRGRSVPARTSSCWRAGPRRFSPHSRWPFPYVVHDRPRPDWV